jgi:hypothetical protein
LSHLIKGVVYSFGVILNCYINYYEDKEINKKNEIKNEFNILSNLSL